MAGDRAGGAADRRDRKRPRLQLAATGAASRMQEMTGSLQPTSDPTTAGEGEQGESRAEQQRDLRFRHLHRSVGQ